ncbi:MAG TPA: hypothetical protein VL171_06765, partial [Verrucomicrobiae bacterium]|nr:hypothetical protein [Verrucomicrobiae bacterium]
LTVKQTDVTSQGVLFSAVVIYFMNLLVMILTATALSHSITFLAVGQSLAGTLASAYAWTLDKLASLWQDAFAFVRHASHH